MPALPAIQLTQVQYDQVLNAFPGKTLAERSQAYQAWVVENIVAYAEAKEIRAIDEASNNLKATKLNELRDKLNPRP